MKEDADQSSRSIPDAKEMQNPSVQAERGPQAPSVSSASHVVEGYDELVQFSLLVNNSTDMLDIQEARLKFDRRSPFPTVGEPGMPTLRKFIRPTDWHRIETMIRNVTELPPEDMYLAGGTPTRFWVCFSCFDESQLRRPRLQDLDEIREDDEMCEEVDVVDEMSGAPRPCDPTL
eukprot:Skav213167  [mRNA]  locus=scaffold11:10575:11545:+ [translate_table: standard]